MCGLNAIERKGLIAIPDEIKSGLKSAESELYKGHYKNCIRICSATTPKIIRLVRNTRRNMQEALHLTKEIKESNGNEDYYSNVSNFWSVIVN